MPTQKNEVPIVLLGKKVEIVMFTYSYVDSLMGDKVY